MPNVGFNKQPPVNPKTGKMEKATSSDARYPGVPDSVMKAKSTLATVTPKMKMKTGW